ncbi:hypothetical protein M404DRAFT_1001854 [Pisolithus tinctorius Marx 270]|uniref:Uncharacterized protein n=1 Tax=Pisolithus tinctorius Marx 270 TaxID=870435 RepID=A0A0C3J1K8_PISTI|nr:hypothetical protein M404DRAFT_1001854 [Pisolithus tinctorius Marx 270]
MHTNAVYMSSSAFTTGGAKENKVCSRVVEKVTKTGFLVRSSRLGTHARKTINV